MNFLNYMCFSHYASFLDSLLYVLWEMFAVSWIWHAVWWLFFLPRFGRMQNLGFLHEQFYIHFQNVLTIIVI